MKHWGIILSLVLVAGFFAIGFINQDVFAPPPARPEKIQVGPIKPESDSGSVFLVIGISASFGSATAGNNAGFTVNTEIKITNQGTRTTEVLVVSSKVKDVVRESGIDKDDGISFEQKKEWPSPEPGIYDVMITTKLLNPAGNPTAEDSNDDTTCVVSENRDGSLNVLCDDGSE